MSIKIEKSDGFLCGTMRIQYEAEKQEIEALVLPEYLEKIIEKKVQRVYLSIIEKIVHFICMEFSCFYPKYKKIYRWHLERPNTVQFHYKKEGNHKLVGIYPLDFSLSARPYAALEIQRLENQLIPLEEAKQNLKKLLPEKDYEKWCADLAKRVRGRMISC